MYRSYNELIHFFADFMPLHYYIFYSHHHGLTKRWKAEFLVLTLTLKVRPVLVSFVKKKFCFKTFKKF